MPRRRSSTTSKDYAPPSRCTDCCIRLPCHSRIVPLKTSIGRPTGRDVRLPHPLSTPSTSVRWLGFPARFTFKKEQRSPSDHSAAFHHQPEALPLRMFATPRLLYEASISSPWEVDLRPMRAASPRRTLGLQNHLRHLLFKHARIACAQPTTNPAAAALPLSFPTTIP